MGLPSDRVSGRGAVLASAALLFSVLTYACLWPPAASMAFLRFQRAQDVKVVASKDEVETALERASMGNKTLIITALNKAYAEDDGMLDLFIRSLRQGEETEFLIKHLLVLAVDQTAFNRCRALELHCHHLVTQDVDLSEEAPYMSQTFIEMMWRRTLFLGDVLRRGYSFIFTDMDVMWLRNPFAQLNHDGEDMQISCDKYNGQPMDDSNTIDIGFYFVASNNKTIALFHEWYAGRNSSEGMEEQDVLYKMKSEGAFRRLGMKVRFLDTSYFGGFCEHSKDFRRVTTVHANCCQSVKAKLSDLTAILKVWKAFNNTSDVTWPSHQACHVSWQREAASKGELETALQEASMENRTLIISVLNKAYAKENGMLDLFLRSLREGEGTEYLMQHLLLVAVDQIALNRCKILKLHCYQLATEGVDFSREQLYMSDGFISMMWQRIHFLGDVLRLGYSFIFTDMDVMWLRNPFTKLNHGDEDLQISCDKYNGQPFNEANPINTGFYFVASNNKTTALFDAWYGSRNNSVGMKEQDALSLMKYKGVFKELGMKVRFLDTLFFGGFCQDSKDIREVITVHANCCRSAKAKLVDLTAVLRVWKSFNGTGRVRWPLHVACYKAWRKEVVIEP